MILRQMQQLISPGKSSEIQHLHIEATSVAGQFTGQVYDTCARAGITVEKLTVRTDQEADTIEVACHAANATTLAQIIGELRALPGVRAVHADLPGIRKKQAIPKDTADKAP